MGNRHKQMVSAPELLVGHVDHTLQPGQRVYAEPSDFAKMREELDETEDCQFDHCVMCSKELSQGDFGLDHVMYYRAGDEARKVAKVRTLPRILYTMCHCSCQENGKAQGQVERREELPRGIRGRGQGARRR